MVYCMYDKSQIIWYINLIVSGDTTLHIVVSESIEDKLTS